jgi:hypothetical protein
MELPAHRPAPPIAGGSGFLERLERWAADARVDESARERSREHWLRHQAAEDGTFCGVLADLADGGASVQVHLRGGTKVAGAIRAVGADVVAVDPATGAGAIVVSLEAVVSVRGGPGGRLVAGDRVAPSDLRFDDVLVELAAEREQVRMLTVDGGVVTGSLRTVGRDVVTLAGDGRADVVGPTYLPRTVVAGVAIDS